MLLSRTIRYKAQKRAGGPLAEGQTLDVPRNWAKFTRAQLRALLLLTVFAANFFIVCHCSARMASPADHSSCCSKKEDKPPCKDGNECGGMHAMKFNLLEKQTAKEMSFDALPSMDISFLWPVRTVNITRVSTETYTYKHPPPDYQSLYQCFLI